MKRLAFLTAIALAAVPTVAAAQPVRAEVNVRVRHDSPPPQGTITRHVPWRQDQRKVPLARQYSANTDRQFINLMGRGGSFRRLTIEGDRGAPLVERIYVEFLDRSSQTIDLNARLPRGAEQDIRLNGNRGIQRIVVYTNPRARGAYSVYGT